MTEPEAPERLFVAGAPIALAVATPSGRYRVTDFWGRCVAEGEAADTVRLGRLPPGWYEVRHGDAAAFIGVVLDRTGLPLPADGKVCADSACGELVKPEHWRTFARMIRLAGIPWVRERLRWRHVEPEPGALTWGKYRTVAEILAAEGIRICQVWHDTPAWTHPGLPDAHAADDLRVVYRFLRAAAAEFRREVQAWEIWNEPDIFFWKHESSRFAGLLRAAARGVRDGNPEALILSASLCSGAGAFASHLLAGRAPDATDRFNWHLYKPPADYPAELDGYRRLAAGIGAAVAPAWMTEAGIRLPGSAGDGARLLSADALREQARFVPRSVVMSLAAGSERHFFFVLPDFLENGNQFGSLRPDLSPAPAFIALSAAANLLGESAVVGRLPEDRVTAWVFKTPRGLVVAAWADEPCELTVEVNPGSPTRFDQFGASTPARVEAGRVRLAVGPDTTYLLGVAAKAAERVQPRPRPPAPRRADPPALAIAAKAGVEFVKNRDAYQLAPGPVPNSIDWDLEVCHLDEDSHASGRIEVDAPAGWRAEPATIPFALEPMGRLAARVRLTTGEPSLASLTVTATARPDAGPSVGVASTFQWDAAGFREAGTAPLAWARADRWRSAGRGLTFVPHGDDGMRVTGGGDRGKGEWWIEGECRLDGPVDLGGYDAVEGAIEGRPDVEEQEVFLMLDEPDGAVRITGGTIAPGPGTARFLVRDLGLAGTTAVRVRLGVWTGDGKVDFTIGRFRLVRLAIAPPVL